MPLESRVLALQLELDDLKAVKDALGGTINDVVMALTASSLRSFLQLHNELPDSQ